MKVSQIQNVNILKNRQTNNNKLSNEGVYYTHPQSNSISNLYYQPNFKGVTFETKVIKKYARQMFPLDGGVFSADNRFIDMHKINWENLCSEKLDIASAPKEKIAAYRFFLALLESYAKNPKNSGNMATDWGSKYGPKNMDIALASQHSLTEYDKKEFLYAVNRAKLKNIAENKSLDVPVFDEKGNFILDMVGVDTETTGTDPMKDKIVQLGALVYKKGKKVFEYTQLVNPGVVIPEQAAAVHGIRNEDVVFQPSIEQVMPEFLAKVMNKANGVIVTWNGLSFDMPLINRFIASVRNNETKKIAKNALKGDSKEIKSIEKLFLERPMHKIVDAYVLHQRIHPYMGLSKKLGKQYHWMFCKPMEDAHDAIADCKGMMPIFEYDCRFLNEHRIDKSKPLTLRQVLQFQNGEQTPNIAINLDPVEGINTAPSYHKSYRLEPLDLVNYFKSYKIVESNMNELSGDIGEVNIQKMKDFGIINCDLGDTRNGFKVRAAETEKIKNTNKNKTQGYLLRSNLEQLLDNAEIEGYGEKSKQEIKDLIIENSKVFVTSENDKALSKGIWIKNVNPDDIPEGNDLPDDSIVKTVMNNYASTHM